VFYEELSERKKTILKAVVEAHIEGGEPVGSKYVVQNGLLTCSSATIRNEMAELEQMGYLEQPHTSAGRVPSELGYRFYVDMLVNQYETVTKEVAQVNQLLKSKMGEIDQILETASRLASKLTNYTGIAIKPKASSITMSRYEVIWFDENNFVIVMITSHGNVKTKKVKTAESITQESVERLAALLNAHLCGISADKINLPLIVELEKAMGSDGFMINAAVKCIYDVMSEIDGGELRYSGINNLLNYPEYSDTRQLGELLGTLEEQSQILDLVSDADSDNVNVLIGSESSVKVMNNSSLVFKPIKKNGRTVGVIGVLGPLRMDYKNVLRTIDEIGGSVADMIGDDRKLDGKVKEGDNDGGK